MSDIFFADSEAVETFLEFAAADSQKYGQVLIQIMSAVMGDMETDLGRLVETRTNFAEYFDTDPFRTKYHLRAYPLVDTVAPVVSFDFSRLYGTDTVIAPTEYFVNYSEGIVTFNNPFNSSNAGLKIVYSGGMGTTTQEVQEAYPSLAGAFVTEVANRFNSRLSLGKLSASIAGGSASFSTPHIFLSNVREVLDLYRRYV